MCQIIVRECGDKPAAEGSSITMMADQYLSLSVGGGVGLTYTIAILSSLIPYDSRIWGMSGPRLPSLMPATKKATPALTSLSISLGGCPASDDAISIDSIIVFGGDRELGMEETNQNFYNELVFEPVEKTG